MDTQYTNLALTLKTADTDTGRVEGFGAIYGVTDRDGDIIAPGAFRDSLKARVPLMLWQHDAKEPIGVWDTVREEVEGLYLAGRLAREGKGREAMELVHMGAVSGLSVGFVTREAERDKATGVRLIRKADLYEVSLVSFPANDGARLAGVKQPGQITTIRELEAALRGAGLSRAAAKAACAHFTGRAGGLEAVTAGGMAQALEDAISAANRLVGVVAYDA